jgi:hypothetical protein
MSDLYSKNDEKIGAFWPGLRISKLHSSSPPATVASLRLKERDIFLRNYFKSYERT